jgi:hypothetical protein
MISKINWTALKATKADGRKHQLGETIYRHTAARGKFSEQITARLHEATYTIYKSKTKTKWSIPVRLYWSQELGRYVTIPD